MNIEQEVLMFGGVECLFVSSSTLTVLNIFCCNLLLSLWCYAS